MPKQQIKLGFIGFCKTDLILYLSRIINSLGEKTAIVDCSSGQELSYSVPVGIYTKDRLDYRGVEVFLNCGETELKELPLDDFYAVLVDYELNGSAVCELSDMDAVFVVSDMQKHHLLPLSDFLLKAGKITNAIRVYRDIPPGKIKARYADSILNLENTADIIAKYEFPLNETEYAVRLTSQYDDIFRFGRISAEYSQMLLDCVTELFGIDKKTAVKALKIAQRGG
ncbi:MAG: hypothetical protein GX494_07985 [Clostridiaceae bacterium]|nr:hypothetical protein [Clostridiaceae bacterium]